MTKTEEPNDFYFQFLLSVNPNSFTDIYKDVTLNVVLELTGLPEELSGKDLGYYLHCEDKVF